MKKHFCLLCLFIASCIITYAQKGNDKLLKKLVEKEVLTQEEADQIETEENQSSSQNAWNNQTEKIRSAFNTPYMQFGGYGLFLYQYDQSARIKHDAKARAAYIYMKGKLPRDIGYSIMAEFVHPLLHEFYAEWTPIKEANIRAGQFKVPFSIENQYALSNLETIMNARSIAALSGGADDVLKLQNERNNGGRDVGLQLSGSLFQTADCSLVKYALGVFQGSGIVSSEQNNAKDFSGSLLFEPIKGLQVGGSTYLGKATYIQEGDSILGDHVRNRWALSAEYKTDRLSARAEWIHGKDAHIKREGVYGVMSYYIIPKKMNGVVKVEYYNKNKDVSAEVLDYTIGTNYYFYNQCRLQLNYTFSDYSKQWGRKNNNSVLAQLQIVF